MSELIVPGRVGPHRESHEPRLKAANFLAAGVSPVSGYLAFQGTKDIPPSGWGMDNNGPDPTNPPFMPNGAGCCGFAAKDHYDVAKTGDPTEIGMSFSPMFPTLLDAYWAYGIAMGEPGPHPDDGVDNKSFLGWLYKIGQIKGYGEVEDEFADWYTQTFNGIILSLIIDGPQASADFNNRPIVWDAMARLEGHDVLGINTYSDGSGDLVSWGQLVHYTLDFRLMNITDRWVIYDENDPYVDWANLTAALTEIHGDVTPIAA